MLDRVDEYRTGRPEDQFDVVAFPPNFQSTPCKPISLDLASYAWDVAAPMDTPCVHAGVASLDGFLFACGGRTGSR
jgi:hypothetical protein